MTQTMSLTKSRTISRADVRAVLSKIMSDLYQIRIYHRVFDEQYEEDTSFDLLLWIYSGYAERIRLLFYAPSASSTVDVHFELKYEVIRAGVITTDDDAGSIPYVDLSGCRFNLLVTTNDQWEALSEQGRRDFYETLKGSWGPSTLNPVYVGGTWGHGRTYSSNGLAASRSIYVR